jgi:hypothetical protein
LKKDIVISGLGGDAEALRSRLKSPEGEKCKSLGQRPRDRVSFIHQALKGRHNYFALSGLIIKE